MLFWGPFFDDAIINNGCVVLYVVFTYRFPFILLHIYRKYILRIFSLLHDRLRHVTPIVVHNAARVLHCEMVTVIEIYKTFCDFHFREVNHVAGQRSVY